MASLIYTACYYIVGLPFGALLAFKFDMEVTGLFIGLCSGDLIFSFTTFFYLLFCIDWVKLAEDISEKMKEEKTLNEPLL